MKSDLHTIILGAGAMGSAAAWHLARRKIPVLALDQFDIPNAQGSSHGQSRLIRLAYNEHPDYVPLLRRTFQLWRELEAESSQKILHQTGGLYLAPPENQLIAGSLASAKTHNLPHELLSARQAARRFPQFRIPQSFTAFYEPDAGFLQPELAISAFAGQALTHGARLHAHESALDWSATKSAVTVRTAHHIYRAKNLIITAGAWTSRLLPFLAPRITVTRQPMLWFHPRKPDLFTLDKFPCWCIASENGGLVYGPPLVPNSPPLALKVAHHFPGTPCTPETLNRNLLPQDINVPRAILAQFLPDALGPLLAHKICMYSLSPDQHFILDQHPRHKNVFIAAGFSGHGFKFAPVVGECLADFVAAGKTRLPIDFLRLARFGNS